MKSLILISIFFLIFSCNNNSGNSQLLKSTQTFISEDGGHIDEKYGSIKQFQEHFFKVKYLKDTIYAQTVQAVNACGNAKAWIKIKSDTIFLTSKEVADELCASTNWNKYEYWIVNPENKKYIVVQGY